MLNDATPTPVSVPRETRRAPGLFSSPPANDVTLTAVELPPHSATAPLIAPRVGPVRRTFRPSHVTTYAPTTCAECGVKNALVTIKRDGRDFPACVGCWRAERTRVPDPQPPQTTDAAESKRFDARLFSALATAGKATIVELAQSAGLLGEDERGTRRGAQADAYNRVRDSMYRLVEAGRVARVRRKRGRKAVFRPVPVRMNRT